MTFSLLTKKYSGYKLFLVNTIVISLFSITRFILKARSTSSSSYASFSFSQKFISEHISFRYLVTYYNDHEEWF